MWHFHFSSLIIFCRAILSFSLIDAIFDIFDAIIIDVPILLRFSFSSFLRWRFSSFSFTISTFSMPVKKFHFDVAIFSRAFIDYRRGLFSLSMPSMLIDDFFDWGCAFIFVKFRWFSLSISDRLPWMIIVGTFTPRGLWCFSAGHFSGFFFAGPWFAMTFLRRADSFRLGYRRLISLPRFLRFCSMRASAYRVSHWIFLPPILSVIAVISLMVAFVATLLWCFWCKVS